MIIIKNNIVYSRGGSLNSGGYYCSVDSQYDYNADDSYKSLGLRACRRII